MKNWLIQFSTLSHKCLPLGQTSCFVMQQKCSMHISVSSDDILKNHVLTLIKLIFFPYFIGGTFKGRCPLFFNLGGVEVKATVIINMA